MSTSIYYFISIIYNGKPKSFNTKFIISYNVCYLSLFIIFTIEASITYFLSCNSFYVDSSISYFFSIFCI